MQNDYQFYQRMAAIKRQQAQDVLTAVATEMEKGVRSERKWSFVLGVASNFVVVFVLGVLASEPV
jgi:hypothetical protein